MNSNELNSQWLDFYALLGVEPDTDKDTLRRKIGETYAQASANCDHRDLNRRHYFQTLVERVLPQARRVLLDPKLRAAYDEQNALHRLGTGGLDYVSFMASSQGGTAVATARQTASSGGEFDALPERVRDEINLAIAVLECVQSGEELDFLPARAISSTSPVSASAAPVSPTPIAPSASTSPTPASTSAAPTSSASSAPQAPKSAPRVSRPQRPEDTYFSETSSQMRDTMPVDEISTPSRPVASRVVTAKSAENLASETPDKATNSGASIEVPDETEPVIRAKVINLSQDAEGKTIHQLREAAAQKAIADDGSLARPKPLNSPNAYKSRVSVEDDSNLPVKKQRRVLSPLTTHLATAVVSTLLIFTIIKSNDTPATTTGRTPLNVIYSSELRPVMENAEAQFEASPEGAGIDVVLQAMDSRSAMNAVLNAGQNAPEVWIPSETVWSNRYNQVAAKFKRPTIKSASQLALSPLVLVTRSERAAPLKSAFPDRKIKSWSALQSLVARDCKGHFGLTDPQKSGSGALVRYFMAREWSGKNNIRGNFPNDVRLWKWLDGFEKNVPEFKSSDAMIKDLALGTTGQYWWALAYESDAIYWMGQGKPLEIFYLPSTYYADHPFCHIERPGLSRTAANARLRFERFLRSTPAQNAMLQSGFRAPEIDLKADIDKNPFKSTAYAARGVLASGFPIGNRLDYRTINALTASWSKRYTS